MEGPDQAVIADFVALGLTGLDFVVLVDDEQGLFDGQQGVAAVDGRIQRGVQCLGVGADLDGEAGALAGGGVSSLGGGSIGAAVGVSGACGRTAGCQRNCHAGSHRRGDDSLVLHVACILLMDLSYTRCLSVTGEH